MTRQTVASQAGARGHDARVPRRCRGRGVPRVPGAPRGGHGRPGRRPPDPGDAGQRPGRSLELQGRQVRVVQRRGQREAPSHVHDPDGPLPGGRAHHGGPAEGVPPDQGPGHRRVVQLRGGAPDPGVPAPAARAGRHLSDDAGGHRPRAGVPEVHRVLPLPGRLPRDPGPRGEQAGLLRAPLLRAAGRAGHAPARHPGPPRARPGARGHRPLQHHEVLHRGLPRAHQDHGQRDHPAEGARRRRPLRPRHVDRPEAGRSRDQRRTGHRAPAP